MVVLRSLLTLPLLAFAAPASAHVSVQPTAATAGAYQVLRFGVGHGCGDAATTALRIEIPAEVAVARPQPKPGWVLEIEGPGQGQPVSAITWRGRLPADQFDEFVVLVKTPARDGALPFGAIQSCSGVESRWTETPAPGKPSTRPAPTLTLTPAAPSPGHDHH